MEVEMEKRKKYNEKRRDEERKRRRRKKVHLCGKSVDVHFIFFTSQELPHAFNYYVISSDFGAYRCGFGC